MRRRVAWKAGVPTAPGGTAKQSAGSTPSWIAWSCWRVRIVLLARRLRIWNMRGPWTISASCCDCSKNTPFVWSSAVAAQYDVSAWPAVRVCATMRASRILTSRVIRRG